MLQNIQRIYCRPQNYAWGKLGSDPDCLVYKLSGQGDTTKRYAEFWMGSHPSLPSLDQNNQPISVNLPYLFKVLSIDQPLSIQIHPNKEQAILLHQTKPNLYPDDNHKPEMAIAVTEFESLIGFAEPQLIIQNIEKNPKLIQELGQDLWNSFKENPQEFLKQIVTQFLSFTQEQLKEILQHFIFPENCCPSLNQQITNTDVGYLFLLIMNHVTMQPGQAVLLEAGLIHSYLKGNIIEVMANSDNVVRCGFTPKEKDIETMKQILKCTMSKPNFVEPKVDQGNQYKYRNYITQYKEFACEYIKLAKQEVSKEFIIKQNTIMLCLHGHGTLLNGENVLEIKFGYTYLINQQSILKFKVIDELELYCCYY